MTGTELETILSEYGKMMSDFCYGLCKNEHDAQDIFQDVCIKLLKCDFTANNAQKTRSFLLLTCLNVFRDYYRVQKRKALREAPGIPDEYFARISAKAEERAEYDALYKALNKLPYKYRAVIALCYLKDVSLTDAASVLKIPVGTVKSRLYKAKRLLKEEMLNYENN